MSSDPNGLGTPIEAVAVENFVTRRGKAYFLHLVTVENSRPGQAWHIHVDMLGCVYLSNTTTGGRLYV